MPQEVQRHVGTIFHSRKLAIRDYLAVIALFCNGVKGTSALQMSRDMNINPKSAFVLLHKLREAMGADRSGRLTSWPATIEIDGAYVGSPEAGEQESRSRRPAHAKTASGRLWLSPASAAAMRGRGL